jgi:starch phosphorylase
MKAAVNGVPSLSVLDGWWVEGCLEGFTGWAIDESGYSGSDGSAEARSLYDKLENTIMPLYYGQPLGNAEVMRCAIAINGSFFNTERVATQ